MLREEKTKILIQNHRRQKVGKTIIGTMNKSNK